MDTRLINGTFAISRGLSVLLAAMALLASTPLVLLAFTGPPWLPTGLALVLLGITFLPGIPSSSRRRAALWALGLCIVGAILATLTMPAKYASSVGSMSLIGRAAAMLVCLSAAAAASGKTFRGFSLRSLGILLAATAVGLTCWATRIMDAQPAAGRAMTIWLLEFVPVTLLLAMSLLARILGTTEYPTNTAEHNSPGTIACHVADQKSHMMNATNTGASRKNHPKNEIR